MAQPAQECRVGVEVRVGDLDPAVPRAGEARLRKPGDEASERAAHRLLVVCLDVNRAVAGAALALESRGEIGYRRGEDGVLGAEAELVREPEPLVVARAHLGAHLLDAARGQLRDERLREQAADALLLRAFRNG